MRQQNPQETRVAQGTATPKTIRKNIKTIRAIPFAAMVLLFAQTGYAANSSQPRVTGIEFKGTSDPSEIDISVEGGVTAEKQVNTADKQIIINLPGATLAGQSKRSIDTSSFNGEVVLISPYLNDSSSGTPGAKIVIQLRDNVDVAFSQNGGQIRLTVPNSSSGSSADAKADAKADAPPADATAGSGTAPAAAGGATSVNATPDSLDRVLVGMKTQQFTGRPITLQVRDLDVRDAFNLIAETSGFNIILDPDVQSLKPVTLSLVDVPWDQALDVLMKTLKLGADRQGNIMRIMTLDSLSKEMDLDQKLKAAEEAVEQRKTVVFPISYADLKQLADLVANLLGIENAGLSAAGRASQALSSTPGAPAATTPPNVALPGASAASSAATGAQGNVFRGNNDLRVMTDQRTNSLIVWAIPSVIERARKIIEVLDTQTPQVVIEGKVVEAQESFTRSIGGNLGFSNVGTGGAFQYANSFNGNNPVPSLFSSPTSLGTGLATASSTSPTAASLAFQIIPFGQTLNATLNLGEAENKLKVIASPKTVVLNKQPATITSTTPVLTPQTGVSQLGGTITQNQIQNAILELDVTPTVTSDGSVLLQLKLERDLPVALAGAGSGQEGVASRNITTNVLVDSGSTLVLGGFTTVTDTRASSGFPILRELPIIGWLFGNDSKENDRDELFFFVTPTVLNPKKAGIQKS